MAEYLAEPEAIRVRTAHLKTLRLERAAIEAAEKQKAVAIKKKVAQSILSLNSDPREEMFARDESTHPDREARHWR